MQSLIYLIRHGAIDRRPAHSFLGQTDLRLNEEGICQAKTLRESLQDIPFTMVFSSPLQRAVQTAALVSGKSATSIHTIEQFTEINLGAWEGLTVDQVKARFPGAYERRGQDLESFRPEGGESFGDLAVRSYPALLGLAQKYPGPLLVVAHAGVNRVLLCRLQHKPLQQLFTIPQEYCGVNILRCTSGKLQIEIVNCRKPVLPDAK